MNLYNTTPLGSHRHRLKKSIFVLWFRQKNVFTTIGWSGTFCFSVQVSIIQVTYS